MGHFSGSVSQRASSQVLWDLLPRYNQRFAIAAAQPSSAFHQPGEGFIPDEVSCFKYQRTVGAENVRVCEKCQQTAEVGKMPLAIARFQTGSGNLVPNILAFCLKSGR